MPGARECSRNRGDKGDVLGDVFADHTVSTGGCGHQLTVDVPKVDGESIDFQFAEVVDTSTGIAFDLNGPGEEFVDGKNVVEAEHPLGMLDRVKQRRLHAANRLRGAVLTLQLGEHPLEFFKTVHGSVVLFIGRDRRVFFVVRLAKLEDARRYLVAFGLRGLQLGNRVCICHPFSLLSPDDIREVPGCPWHVPQHPCNNKVRGNPRIVRQRNEVDCAVVLVSGAHNTHTLRSQRSCQRQPRNERNTESGAHECHHRGCVVRLMGDGRFEPGECTHRQQVAAAERASRNPLVGREVSHIDTLLPGERM